MLNYLADSDKVILLVKYSFIPFIELVIQINAMPILFKREFQKAQVDSILAQAQDQPYL